MSQFEFATAGEIRFGAGTVDQAPGFARRFGTRALVVTGAHPERAGALLARLRAEGLRTTVFPVAGEPELETVTRGAALARSEDCEVILGFGGGSAIDAGKAIAALCANPGELMDYLEVIGAAQPLLQAPLPFIAIPTTAGTGAEVTRNAVLASPAHRVKVSLRSVLMLPRVAIVDPELTRDLPPAITAATGMDALTQLIEPYVSRRANPMVDALCLEGIPRAARALPAVFADGENAPARAEMALASLWSGMALASAGLGAAHGLAGPVGGMFPAPHGAICAALLPAVMETNLAALRARAPASPILARYDRVAQLLTGDPEARAADGVEQVRRLAQTLQIPGLRRYGVTADQAAELARKASRASSMKANPLPLTEEELAGILRAAI